MYEYNQHFDIKQLIDLCFLCVKEHPLFMNTKLKIMKYMINTRTYMLTLLILTTIPPINHSAVWSLYICNVEMWLRGLRI